MLQFTVGPFVGCKSPVQFAQQLWLRLGELGLRAGELFGPPMARLAARRAALASALALTAFFVIAGRLPPLIALLGLLAAAVLAALWPAEDGSAGGRSGAGVEGGAANPQWRLVLDAVQVPAIALDPAATVVHANRLAEDQFGARRRGSHIATVSRDPDLLAAVEEAIDTRQPRTVELHWRVPLERRLLATMVPLEHASPAHGSPTLLITFRDLTEEDRLARMRADFVAYASHELRTPLASLKGYVETLQGSAKDDPAARERFLNTMSGQAERMSRLVDDLLSLSRVEMREYLPPSGEVELGAVLAEVVQTLEPLAEQNGVAVSLSPDDGPAVVQGDYDELAQVFQNLVQNAIKYGRSGGKVEVRLVRERSARAARFRVDVIDDGPGIAREHLPRLTERFYRVSVSESREKGGTGLGLAIVKHILNRHRGTLAIASTLGQGSTFSVSLPAVRG
jgi:two-component system, OmpR family, phosphate regulon sensor histidine kinase PhoR